jgi:hypothetical protein
VLARDNDPFFKGTPAHIRDAEWFAHIWADFGYTTGVHLRRVHYQILSTGQTRADGEPYENTLNCWSELCQAGAAARILGLVDPEAFADRRNPDPVLHRMARDASPGAPRIGFYPATWRLPAIDPGELSDVELLLPEPFAAGYDYHPDDQPVLLELWVEKSGVRDVLDPVCRRAGANYMEGIGFESITQTIRLLRRAERHGRPAHVFYVSDFDPAGDGMPVAVARQVQYWREALEIEQEVSLEPIALTHEQAVTYQLPRIPIKDTDRRAGQWEIRYGEGVTELDALEALHPGRLAEIAWHAMRPHLDPDLRSRLILAQREAQRIIFEQWAAASAPLQAEADRLTGEARAIAAEHAQRIAELVAEQLSGLEPFADRAAELVAEAERLARQLDLDLPARPEPEAEGMDGRPLLFDSRRDWLEQLRVFKTQQGRDGNHD